SRTASFTLSLHDALPICDRHPGGKFRHRQRGVLREWCADWWDARWGRGDRRPPVPAAGGGEKGSRSPISTDYLTGTQRRRDTDRSEEHTSELQSLRHLVC